MRGWLFGFVMGCASGSGAAPASADLEDIEARIASLESDRTSLEARVVELEAENATLRADVDAGATAAAALTQQVSGLAELQVTDSERIRVLEESDFATITYVDSRGFATEAGTSDRFDSLQDGLDEVVADVTSLSLTSDHLVDAVNDLTTDVGGLVDDVAGLTAITDVANELLAYVTVDSSTDAVVFTGANVYVQSGSGTTDGTVNGLGNLIIGYAEDAAGDDDRTGSHNLVLGREHSWTSYGGIVAGYDNTLTGAGASVLGGEQNLASAAYATVLGGYINVADAEWSSIVGGTQNEASGVYAAVAGGAYNEASGMGASVTAGHDNLASAPYASVTGGFSGIASANNAAVSGGGHNTASGVASSVMGGSTQTVTSNYGYGP
jgi:hypothetical protein